MYPSTYDKRKDFEKRLMLRDLDGVYSDIVKMFEDPNHMKNIWDDNSLLTYNKLKLEGLIEEFTVLTRQLQEHLQNDLLTADLSENLTYLTTQASFSESFESQNVHSETAESDDFQLGPGMYNCFTSQPNNEPTYGTVGNGLGSLQQSSGTNVCSTFQANNVHPGATKTTGPPKFSQRSGMNNYHTPQYDKIFNNVTEVEGYVPDPNDHQLQDNYQITSNHNNAINGAGREAKMLQEPRMSNCFSSPYDYKEYNGPESFSRGTKNRCPFTGYRFPEVKTQEPEMNDRSNQQQQWQQPIRYSSINIGRSEVGNTEDDWSITGNTGGSGVADVTLGSGSYSSLQQNNVYTGATAAGVSSRFSCYPGRTYGVIQQQQRYPMEYCSAKTTGLLKNKPQFRIYPYNQSPNWEDFLSEGQPKTPAAVSPCECELCNSSNVLERIKI